MNKYFLPVYHSELKPWIKWWILKRLNGGQSSLKAVTISSGTLTKVDKSKALSIKEYYGNTVQNGTPTPTSPIEISTVSGDNEVVVCGKNKLDISNMQTGTKNGITLTKNDATGEITISGTATAYTPYNIPCNISGTNMYSCDNWGKVTLFLQYNGSGIPQGSNIISNKSYTGNVDNIVVAVSRGDTVNKTIRLQVESGTTVTQFEPYTGNSYKLDLKSKNLFDENTYNNSSLYAIQSLYFSYVKMPDSFKRKFYGNMTLTGTQQNLVFGFSNSNNSISTRILSNGTISSNVLYDFTNAENVYLIIGNSQQVNITRDIPLIYNNYKIMISENANEPYESYYNYELCKIGDYKDKIVNVNGTWKIEKKVGKAIYNGTENWYFTSNCCYINNIVDTVKRPPNNNTKANILCDYYQIDTLANCYNNVTDKRISVNNGGYVYIYDTSFTSANDIKTWLTTHNVSLYYALANTTTETITNTNLISQLNALYEFYVNSSTVNVSNNSEIPLEVLLEYYGR